MPKTIQNLYGNKVRTRICGICVNDDGMLLVNHRGLSTGDFWAPPGGGIEYNESCHQALERELNEETGLSITVNGLLFVCEYIEPPLHAIELFFEVTANGGQLKRGIDPEMNSKDQIIADVQFLTWQKIKELPPNQLHGIFKYVADPIKIRDLRGYFKL